MGERLRITLTGIVGEVLWGVDTESGCAVVWDQRLVRFRAPTREEEMGAKADRRREDSRS